MDELDDFIMKLFDEHREQLVKILSNQLARELCSLCYTIMMREASTEDFGKQELFEEFMKEINK